MIFPQEYKTIGISNTTPQRGDSIYFSTQYVIVENPLRIYAVENTGEGLIRTITSVTLLADEHQITVLEEAPDSCNYSVLVEKASRLCNHKINTVIITAMDRHTTFIHQPDVNQLFEIEIIDLTPPHPPWLIYTIKKLHKAGVWSRLPLRFSEKTLNLQQFEGEHTMFPCSASQLEGSYLDTATEASENTTLVGCDISAQIYNAKFQKEPKQHVNICPLREELHQPAKPFITKCCQAEKTGLTTLNNTPGVIVHWGASEYDIIEAVRNLYQHCKEKHDENRSG
jgi:hypothetical protein